MQERLDGGEDGCNIIRWAPSGLEDVEADAAVSVHVRVEHAAHKLDEGGFVRVCFVEFEGQLEDTIFKRGLLGSKIRIRKIL